jgi:hypothetical protein
MENHHFNSVHQTQWAISSIPRSIGFASFPKVFSWLSYLAVAPNLGKNPSPWDSAIEMEVV